MLTASIILPHLCLLLPLDNSQNFNQEDSDGDSDEDEDEDEDANSDEDSGSDYIEYRDGEN